MDSLPPEIVTNILTYLDPVTITVCRQVCRRWWILTTSLANPLYFPRILANVLQFLQYAGIRSIKNCRLVCQFWKDGLDKLTYSNKLLCLKGLTDLSLHDPHELLYRTWNPFPSRIVQAKLCHGHDDPTKCSELTENLHEDKFFEWFGDQVGYLQVSIQHSKCTERHFAKVLMHMRNLRGLSISESPSPHRFSKHMEDSSFEHLDSLPSYELGTFDELRFIKLDDSDTTLKYTDLYRRIIERSPKLEHLEINGYHHLDVGISFLKLLSDRQPTPLNLSKLKMDAEDPNTTEILTVLSKAHFPLTFFSIKVNSFGDYETCSMCTQLLHSALQNFGPTLERLELKIVWFNNGQFEDSPLLHTFPSSSSLVKLKRLKLVGFVGPVEFLSDFASLTALMIVDRAELQEIVDEIKRCNPNLNEIYFPEAYRPNSVGWRMTQTYRDFMYENDLTFIPKYCGLAQEGFP